MLWGIRATRLLLPHASHVRLTPSLGPKYWTTSKQLLSFLDPLLQVGFGLLAGGGLGDGTQSCMRSRAVTCMEAPKLQEITSKACLEG